MELRDRDGHRDRHDGSARRCDARRVRRGGRPPRARRTPDRRKSGSREDARGSAEAAARGELRGGVDRRERVQGCTGGADCAESAAIGVGGSGRTAAKQRSSIDA